MYIYEILIHSDNITLGADQESFDNLTGAVLKMEALPWWYNIVTCYWHINVPDILSRNYFLYLKFYIRNRKHQDLVYFFENYWNYMK